MSSLYMGQIAQKCPNTCVGGRGQLFFHLWRFGRKLPPENASDIFSSLGILEGSPPALAGVSAGVSVGVAVGVSVGVSVGQTLPIFSHP